MVTEGSSARVSVLDPLGKNLKPGVAAYFALINNMAEALEQCLRNRESYRR